MKENALRSAYSRFLVPGRILLSGHSHQAWPDVARDAQLEAFDDAARWVDDKWDRSVFPAMDEVGAWVLERMGFAKNDPIAFGESTHQLVYRLLSSFESGSRPRVVTTGGEFHSLYRQLSRLSEEGWEINWVDPQPRNNLASRLLEAITPDTAMVAVSAVMFEDAYVLDRLGDIIARAHEVGAIPLIDAYHGFNAVPLDWGPARDQVYAVAGGYKYAGMGNGICWMRFPADCNLRPQYTGWFADFDALAEPRVTGRAVRYAKGSMRFAGATFQCSAFYRARAVLRHWDAFGLDLPALRANYVRQTARIISVLDGLADSPELLSQREDDRRGPFVTVRIPRAGEVVARLRERGVFVDARGELLRIGPAPYVSDEEIDQGVEAVVAASRAFS